MYLFLKVSDYKSKLLFYKHFMVYASYERKLLATKFCRKMWGQRQSLTKAENSISLFIINAILYVAVFDREREREKQWEVDRSFGHFNGHSLALYIVKNQ